MAQTFNTILSFVKSTSRKDRRKGVGSLSVSAVAGGGVGSAADSATQAWVRDNFVDKTTEQEISALKIFSQGIKIGDVSLFKHPDGYVYLDETLVLKGGVVMYGNSSGVNVPSIFDSLPIDGYTIKRDGNGALYVDETALSVSGGGGGGGVADSVHWNNVIGKPSWIGSTKPTYKYSEIEERPDLSVYAKLSDIPSLNGYATQTWVENKGYLLATTASNTYQPKITSSNKLAYSLISNTPDLSVYALNTDLAKKWTQNDVKIANWDSAYSWGNHAAAGYAKASDVTNKFKNYVKLAGDGQSITAQHNFANGLKIGGVSLRKVDNYLYLDSSLVLSGGVTMYGDDGTTVKPIWESIPLDSSTLAWLDGKLSVIGGVGGGGISEEFLNVTLQGYQPLLSTANKLPYTLISGTPDLSVYAKTTDIPTKLSQLTDDVVAGKYLPLSGGTMTGSITTRSNVYSWANAKTVGHIIAGHKASGNAAPIISTALASGGYGKLAQVSDQFGLYAYAANDSTPSIRVALYPEAGEIRIMGNTIPMSTTTYNLGSASAKWSNVYATSFIGNLTGNADSATESTSTHRFKYVLATNECDLNSILTGGGILYNYGSQASGYIVNAPSGYKYGSCVQFQSHSDSADNRLAGQLFWDVNHVSETDATRYLYWRAADRNGWTYSKWHQIAFTDSNVASATKLANKVSLWGNVFDGTSNLEGNIYLSNAARIYMRNATGNNMAVMYVPTSNNLQIGIGVAERGGATNIYGNLIRLRCGTGGTDALYVNASGNVTIGASDLAGATNKMYVDGDVTFSSKVVIGTIPVYESVDGTLYVDANVVFRGGVAMYGNTTTTINEE